VVLQLVRLAWRRERVIASEGTDRMLKFRRNIGASNVAKYLARNAEDFLIGKLLGIEVSLFYNRVNSMIMVPR
tara:strand:- start:8185 stop:8403 length:219 start_codon:yes stop_codon:yes gene_type:complete